MPTTREPSEPVTEREWNESDDPAAMLDHLQQTRDASDRKLRLLTVAAWYRYQRLSESGPGWAATKAAERTAESLRGFSIRELKRARKELDFAVGFIAGRSLRARKEERAEQVALLHCIFGPLAFRAVVLDPSWRTNEVVALAQRVYGDGTWDQLPVLGDALIDAGCDDTEVLAHCRSPGP